MLKKEDKIWNCWRCTERWESFCITNSVRNIICWQHKKDQYHHKSKTIWFMGWNCLEGSYWRFSFPDTITKRFWWILISKSTIEGEQPFITCELEYANYCPVPKFFSRKSLPVLDNPISIKEITVSEKRLKEGKSTADAQSMPKRPSIYSLRNTGTHRPLHLNTVITAAQLLAYN